MLRRKHFLAEAKVRMSGQRHQLPLYLFIVLTTCDECHNASMQSRAWDRKGERQPPLRWRKDYEARWTARALSSGLGNRGIDVCYDPTVPREFFLVHRVKTIRNSPLCCRLSPCPARIVSVINDF